MIKYIKYVRGDTVSGINHLKLSHLIDLAEFEHLLENLYKATGIPNGLVGENGELLSQTGWTNACALFHRTHPKAQRQCQESNIALMRNLHHNQVACAQCKNGLLDYATPIVIEGKRLATLFLGQVFNETPDLKLFRQQAVEFGYDEAKYLEAIREVPIVSKERMEALMECMVGMAQMLATSTLSRIRETKIMHELHRSTEQRIQLEDILEFSPVGIGWVDEYGRIEYLNRQFTLLFGYTREDLMDLETSYRTLCPDSHYRKTVIVPWQKAVRTSRHTGTTPPDLEVNLTSANQTQLRVLIRISWIGNKQLATFNDITAHWHSERRNQAHDHMLQMVAKGMPLSDILHAIVHTVESEDPTALCSILLLDEKGENLLTGAAPSLPAFYNDAIHGIQIGHGVGSCGTAAYTRKRVIVENILEHEYWQPYLSLTRQAGLMACWSEPILSANGTVLGTFAIYHKVPATPTASDIENINFAASLAAIAIENTQVRSELEDRAYSDYLTGLPNRRYFIEKAQEELSRHHRYGGHLALIMFDIDYFKNINDAHGHHIGDIVLQKIADVCRPLLRNIDMIGRIGGEEFAVLLPQTGAHEAQIIAERLRLAIAQACVVVSQNASVHFTASFGVCVVTDVPMDIDRLLHQADNTLYLAKESGRNCVCLAR
jgi:diguanylate cyclase (GGDEF)-like protein